MMMFLQFAKSVNKYNIQKYKQPTNIPNNVMLWLSFSFGNYQEILILSIMCAAAYDDFDEHEDQVFQSE